MKPSAMVTLNRFPRRIRNLLFYFWNGLLGILYTLLLPVVILTVLILVLVLTNLFIR